MSYWGKNCEHLLTFCKKGSNQIARRYAQPAVSAGTSVRKTVLLRLRKWLTSETNLPVTKTEGLHRVHSKAKYTTAAEVSGTIKNFLCAMKLGKFHMPDG